MDQAPQEIWPYKSGDWFVNEQFNSSKQLLPLPYPATILPCLKPFGRCCIGESGFLCALRKSSSFFNRQLGFRVSLLTIYGILRWTHPASSPALEANNIWKFPKPKQQANEAEIFFLTCYFELIKSFKYTVFFILTTTGMDHIQSKLLRWVLNLNQEGAKDTCWKYIFTYPNCGHFFFLNTAKLNKW